jgi:tRNA wybutosine-synthesizing protein 2
MDNDQDRASPSTFTISSPKEIAEEVRGLILENRLFDPGRSIARDDLIHFPIILPKGRGLQWIAGLFGPLFERLDITTSDRTSERYPRPSPFEKITASLEGLIEPEKMIFLPRKWDMIGDCLVLKLDGFSGDDVKKIVGVYEKILKARYCLNDTSGIHGELRKPTFQVLSEPPDRNWEVTHVENGVRYTLDPMKVMFSSGNVDERMGIIDVINNGPIPPRIKAHGGKEVVLDMFAGIGYFTLPISMKCSVGTVYSVEKNPISHYYLERNIRDNKVQRRVVPIYGDNRKVRLPEQADRIIMGYVGGTIGFVKRAAELSSNEGSIIHLHDTVKIENGPIDLFHEVEKRMAGSGRKVRLLSHRKVKSYAPRIDHVVLDILLGGPSLDLCT